MSDPITENQHYLTKNLTNLREILVILVQHKVINELEKDEIITGRTDFERNDNLWTLIKKKEWSRQKKLFLKILRQTRNEHCADEIEGLPRQEENINSASGQSTNISVNENNTKPKDDAGTDSSFWKATSSSQSDTSLKRQSLTRVYEPIKNPKFFSKEDKLKELFYANKFEESVQLAKSIDEVLSTKKTKFNYAFCMYKNGQVLDCFNALYISFDKRPVEEYPGFTKCLKILAEYWKANEIKFGLLDLEEELMQLAIEALLFYCSVRLGHTIDKALNYKPYLFSISDLIQLLSLTQIPSYCLKVDGGKLELKFDGQIKKIELRDCCLSFKEQLSSDELALTYVKFSRNDKLLKQVTVNGFLDLEKINRLSLTCHEFCMNIDLSEDVSMDFLHLNNVTVLDWEKAIWNVKKLSLDSIILIQKSKMKIGEMEISNSSINISCLPETVSKLSLTAVTFSGKTDLLNLKYLKLDSMDSLSLSNFWSVCLTHIHFNRMQGVDVSLLPISVRQIKISAIPKDKEGKSLFFSRSPAPSNFLDMPLIITGPRKLEKLILENEYWVDYWNHFQTDSLVLYHENLGIQDVEKLIEKNIKVVAIGEIIWSLNPMNQNYQFLDKTSNYYFFEEGMGRAIDKKKFDELLKLNVI